MLRRFFLVLVIVSVSAVRVPAAGSWPQFRGPNSSGNAVGDAPLPAEIGPDKNVVWKTDLPPGHSSPVVAGDRIYVTAVDGERLLTIGLDRAMGAILWQQEAPHDVLEEIHQIGSYAQPSPASDAERVVSFFGSYGLMCYDPNGNLLWQRPLGPFKNNYGAASSPIIVDDAVILNQDHDENSFLLAVDKRSGETLWQTDRSEFPRGFSTPIVWEQHGRKSIVVAGALRAVGYDPATGAESWSIGGISRISTKTPVIGRDGTLYLTEWAPGGDAEDRIVADPFDKTVEAFDKNQNGTIELPELPLGPLKVRFNQIDRNKDGTITEAEYVWMEKIFNTANNVLLAVKPGESRDITEANVIWKQTRYLPYVPSSVSFDDCLLMIKDGGIITCFDAKSGEITKMGRAPHTAQYYASPVVGDGKVYLLSQKGGLTVLSAEPKWKVLANADFDEPAFATPALVDGKIYLRTQSKLYCFALPDEQR